MNEVVVTCPKCGSKKVEDVPPSEMYKPCQTKIPFKCNDCGFVW